MISIILTLLIELVNTGFAGHINDPYQMAGLGLASMIVGCWHALYTGLNGALETLAAQAYGGKNYYLCGKILNRGQVTLFLAYIPLAVIMFFTGSLL